MSGFENGVLVANNVNFNTGLAPPHPGLIEFDKQMIIGSTALNAGGTHLNIGEITSTGGTIDVTFDSPNVNIEVVAIGNSIQKIVRQVFTTSGSYVPTADMIYADIETVGAGGGGGGAATGAWQNAAGGGSAGGYARGIFNATTIGASQAVTIGAGGTAGANTGAGPGGTGGTTSLGALISATGGDGGHGANSAGIFPGGGAPGIGTGGDFQTEGAAGLSGSIFVGGVVIGGEGGETFFGGSGVGAVAGTATSIIGNNGNSAGGGGGGAAVNGAGASQTGGVGANGIVIITEYIGLPVGGSVVPTQITVDGASGGGTNPVLPDSLGNFNFSGGRIGAGLAGVNSIKTLSLAAHSFITAIQTAAATVSSDPSMAGVCSFNSAQFIIDADGYVSLVGGSGSSVEFLKGNDGVQVGPDSGGNINVVTANSTVKFLGTTNTETLDFNLTNLILGSSSSSITTANHNVGLGMTVLNALTTGTECVALGYQSQKLSTIGTRNTSIGSLSLSSLLSAFDCTAIGANCLTSNTASDGNTAGGSFCLNLCTGASNTAFGKSVLQNMTSGASNSAFGSGIGLGLLTGSFNIFVGANTASAYTSSESSNILIGNAGVVGESNVTRIGTQGTGSGQQSQFYPAGVLNTTSGQVVKTTIPGAYPYTTLITDYVIFVDTSAARTINLIASPVTGTTYRIKDNTGNAVFQNIAITPASGTIDGAATYFISSNWASVDVVYNGTSWRIL